MRITGVTSQVVIHFGSQFHGIGYVLPLDVTLVSQGQEVTQLLVDLGEGETTTVWLPTSQHRGIGEDPFMYPSAKWGVVVREVQSKVGATLEVVAVLQHGGFYRCFANEADVRRSAS